MRKIALITAAVMMSVGSIGTAVATVAPVSATPVSVSGVAQNRLALGLAQPAQDDSSMTTSESRGGIGRTGVVVAVIALVAIGAGIYAATDNNNTRPTSS